MSLLRAFIALEIPPEIQTGISNYVATLKRTSNKAVRWVPVDNIHLTLKFLGDVSPANLEIIKPALRAEASRYKPFIIEIGTLGVFPNLRQPRVIWIGIQAASTLESLQRGIESVMTRLGYPGEDRPFSPHLTIGRVSQHATSADKQNIRSSVERADIGTIGTTRIEAEHLFRSDLHSTGAIYTCLYSAPLPG
jgi:2'-5' RNA ligase